MTNRAVNVSPITLQEFYRDIEKPGLIGRLERMPVKFREQFAAELAHFQRVEDGKRARPDLLPDGFGYTRGKQTLANKHGLPTPFVGKDTPRPDIAAIPGYKERWQAVDNRLATDVTADALQARMGTDADRPLPPPTLRDQIAAAVDLHTQD